MSNNSFGEFLGCLAIVAVVLIIIPTCLLLGASITGGALWLIYNYGYLMFATGLEIPFWNFMLVGLGINILLTVIRRSFRVKVEKPDRDIEQLVDDLLKSR